MSAVISASLSESHCSETINPQPPCPARPSKWNPWSYPLSLQQKHPVFDCFRVSAIWAQTSLAHPRSCCWVVSSFKGYPELPKGRAAPHTIDLGWSFKPLASVSKPVFTKLWSKILSTALWYRVDSASNRNGYQEYFLRGTGGRCLGLTNLPHYFLRGTGGRCLGLTTLPHYFLRGTGGRCVGLTTLPHSYADCLEVWGTHPPGNLRACWGLYRDCFALMTQDIS